MTGPKGISKEIQVLLDQADSRFGKKAQVFEQRLLQSYKHALDETKARIAKTFAEAGGKPTLVQMRRFNRLAKIEASIMQDIKSLTQVSVNTLGQGIKDTFLASYKETGASLEMGLGVSLGFGDLPSKDAVGYAVSDNTWLDALKGHNATLMTDIKREFETVLRINARQEVVSGIILGKSYKDVEDALIQRFNIAATRAKTIAFTEMHKSHSKGRVEGVRIGMESAKELGIVAVKVWRHNGVGEPRPDHLAADGTEAGPDGLFFIGGEKLEGPGLGALPENNINCHCSAQMEVKNSEKASEADLLASQKYADSMMAAGSKFEPTEKGLLELNPDQLSGQGKIISEALHQAGKSATLSEIWTIADPMLKAAGSTSKDTKTIIAWYLNKWKKEGLLHQPGAPVKKIHIDPLKPFVPVKPGEPVFVTLEDVLEFQKNKGMGPCAPVSWVLRDMGLGEIEYGMYGIQGDYEKSITHFWIRTKENKILDITAPKPGGTYWDIQKIGAGEAIDDPYTLDDIAWWKNRIKKVSETPPSTGVVTKEQALKKLEALEKDIGVFKKNPVPYAEAPEALKYANNLPATEYQAAPVKEVKMSKIRSTQSGIRPEKVQAFIENPDLLLEQTQVSADIYPVLVKQGDLYYTVDGNHRIAASYLSGSKTIKAKVIEMPEVKTTLKGTVPVKSDGTIGIFSHADTAPTKTIGKKDKIPGKLATGEKDVAKNNLAWHVERIDDNHGVKLSFVDKSGQLLQTPEELKPFEAAAQKARIRVINNSLYDMREQSEVLDTLIINMAQNPIAQKQLNVTVIDGSFVPKAVYSNPAKAKASSSSVGMCRSASDNRIFVAGNPPETSTVLHIDTGKHNVTLDTGGIFRHEFGHKIEQRFMTAKDAHGQTFFDVIAGKDMKKLVSQYAGSKPTEAFAECFSAITSPLYESASVKLPEEIEKWFIDVFKLKNKASVKKPVSAHPLPSTPKKTKLSTSYLEETKLYFNSIAGVQRGAVVQYSESSYVRVNDVLRNAPGAVATTSSKEVTETLTKVLAAAPKAEVTTYRGMRFGSPAKVAAWMKENNIAPGSLYVDPGFMSTSLAPNIASSFGMSSDGVFFVVKGKKGVWIGGISSHRREVEVLFNRGTKFKVMSVHEGGDMRGIFNDLGISGDGIEHIIVLEEIV